MMVEKEGLDISISRQADLLGISRGSIYYQPVPESEADVSLMNLIDQIYTKWPFYGARRIKKELKRNYQLAVNRKHISRLMQVMGLEAIYPKRNTSKPDNQNRTYPYLLRNVTINHPNQVWGTDITYIKLEHSFCYLVG